MNRCTDMFGTTCGACLLLASALLALNGSWLHAGAGTLFGVGMIMAGLDVPRGAADKAWADTSASARFSCSRSWP
jgi:hypothetical protein